LLARAQEVLAAGGTVCWITSKSLQVQLAGEARMWLAEDQQPASYAKAEADRPFIYLTHRLAQLRVAQLLKRGSFDLLIVDEAAEVGGGGANPKHKTYQALRRLSVQAKSSVFATAEPLSSIHAMDLWAIADCAAIPGLPSREVMESWVQWQEQHTPSRHVVHMPVGISHDGFNNLLTAIRPHQMRTRIDAIANLVPLKVIQHPVVLSERAQESYDDVRVLRGLNGHLARQKASRDSVAIVPAVMELLQDTYTEHSSVLVYSKMFDLLGPLARGMTDIGISFLQIDGSVPEGKRGKIIERHQRGEARVLLITSAAEAGINAQRSTLLLSLVRSYSPSRERQREGRIRRIGSVGPELVHAIVRPEVGHEDRRDEILDAKERLIAAMWVALS
jgi:hypothetical protein